jgi:glutamyl/glutaminyl-tRNA synthetase
MLGRKHKEGTYVIRLKGDMSSLDYSIRDPNIARIIDYPHPLTLDKYCVWPTYDFEVVVEDQVCGVTHILRSSEFHVGLQELVRNLLGFPAISVTQFSRFNFQGTPVQKRLLRPLVEEKLVTGWDDPRMPTIEGVIRRGIIPEAIRRFTVEVGYTKSEHTFDWSLLLSVNRKILDPVTKRVYFVPDPVSLTVQGAPVKQVTIPFHPQEKLGERTIDTAGLFFVPSADISKMNEGAGIPADRALQRQAALQGSGRSRVQFRERRDDPGQQKAPVGDAGGLARRRGARALRALQRGRDVQQGQSENEARRGGEELRRPEAGRHRTVPALWLRPGRRPFQVRPDTRLVPDCSRFKNTTGRRTRDHFRI